MVNNERLHLRLWNKDFTLFLLCTIQASFGSSLSGIALSFLVLKLTHSPTAMSITLALGYIPAVLTPIIATIVDRISLKPPLVICNTLRAAALVLLYIGLKFDLFNIYSIYAVALFNGFIGTISIPAAQSLVPTLIPMNQLARGNSLLAMANQGMSLVGFVFGGFLVGFIGPEFSIFIEGICYFIVSGLLLFVHMPMVKHGQKKSFFADFSSGLELIKKSHLILMVMAMFFLINFFMAPLSVLVPVHMSDIGKGASGYGLFMALVTAGMLSGNSIISIIGEAFKNRAGITYAWLCLGIALAGLAVLNSFYFSLCWGFVFGNSVAILNTGTIVLLQKVVPAEFRARVFGTVGTVAQFGRPIALFLLGYILKLVTMKEIFICGMLFSLIFSLVWMVFNRKREVILADNS